MPEVLQLLGPSTGGIRKHVAWLAGELETRGWAVRTAGPRGVLDGVARQDAVVPVPLGRRALVESIGRADILHAHGLKAGWLASTVRRRPPLVVTVHNLVLDEAAGRAAPVLRVLEGWLPRRADAVIAVSEEIGRRFGGRPNVSVIPPAGPAPVVTRSRDDVRAELGVAPGERLLVAVARLHPQKDLPTLLDAVRGLDGVRLVVFGTGPDEAALRAMASECVVFAGQRASVADEIAAADALVISSRWESGPLVLVEAMAVGTPVITTAVGLAPSLVRDRETGRLVPVGDAPALRRAIEDVLSAPDDARRMAHAAGALYGRTLSSDALASRIEAVYREVLR